MKRTLTANLLGRGESADAVTDVAAAMRTLVRSRTRRAYANRIVASGSAGGTARSGRDAASVDRLRETPHEIGAEAAQRLRSDRYGVGSARRPRTRVVRAARARSSVVGQPDN